MRDASRQMVEDLEEVWDVEEVEIVAVAMEGEQENSAGKEAQTPMDWKNGPLRMGASSIGVRNVEGGTPHTKPMSTVE